MKPTKGMNWMSKGKEIPALMEILEAEAAAICKHYRVEPEVAKQLLAATFASRPSLLQKIAAKATQQDITRLREYKEAVKEARKQIYYHLRRYHRDKEGEDQLTEKLACLVKEAASPAEIKRVTDELLRTHISTQERFDHYQVFYDALLAITPPPSTILDMGCGIHPLSYPFQKEGRHTRLYLAIDKDWEAINILETFAPAVAPAKLIPLCEDIAQLDQQDYTVYGVDSFDLVFMMKLIPVISRQSKALLPKLVDLPARQILVTASTTAMTREEEISRREDHLLRQFIKMTNRPILHTLRIESEFGYLLGSA